jgi:hypothetical protein
VHGGGNAPLQMVANETGSNAFDLIAGTGGLVRTDGGSWTADGFAVGQQVLLSIDGGLTGSYTITGISSTGTHNLDNTLTLLAAAGAPAITGKTGATGTISVTDQLAVVSGQAIGDQTTGNFDVAGSEPAPFSASPTPPTPPAPAATGVCWSWAARP